MRYSVCRSERRKWEKKNEARLTSMRGLEVEISECEAASSTGEAHSKNLHKTLLSEKDHLVDLQSEEKAYIRETSELLAPYVYLSPVREPEEAGNF